MAKFFDILLGRPLASAEEAEQRVGVLAGIPMLGLDALASAAYGPEAALTILIPLGAAGLSYFGPIVLIILAILAILYFSYRQTIFAYPTGGGSYTVAKENLGVRAGLFAAAALLVDYVLTVAVGISAGVGALVSAVPSLHSHMVGLCLGILAIITIVNLRGTRESGLAFALPTYLFVASLGGVILFGVYKSLTTAGHPVAIEHPPIIPASLTAVTAWLLVRSFASGCTAMTGVEAVSNGVGAFARPTAKRAVATLGWIVAILMSMLLGIAYLCHAYGIAATDPNSSSYQSVISQLVAAIVGRGWLYYVTIGSVLAVLALSANTGFADFPRLCRLLGKDEYLPRIFTQRGRRLVLSLGIIILAVLSGALLVGFGGVTDRLIPLFAVGAFLAFTLSQAGMVIHWKKVGPAKAAMIINGIGAVGTGVALVVVLVAKLLAGAWVTLILIPAFVFLFEAIRRHYDSVRVNTSCTRPIEIEPEQPPIVLVPIKDWNSIAQKAIQFAMRMSKDVRAVHVGVNEEELHKLKRDWDRYVEQPLQEKWIDPPALILLVSPYRRLFTPLIDLIHHIEKEEPNRLIAIVIPELVETAWWQHLLHNQRAAGLKAALLYRGDKNLVVINVPWYIGDADEAATS